MPDGAQLDLLDLLTAPPVSIEAVKIDTPPSFPSRSYWWDEAIAGSEAAMNVRIHVSEHWTGIVVEQINDPVLGRRILWHSGTVTRYPYTATCIPSRTIFMTAEGAQGIGLPLTMLDRGDGYVRYMIKGPTDV